MQAILQNLKSAEELGDQSLGHVVKHPTVKLFCCRQKRSYRFGWRWKDDYISAAGGESTPLACAFLIPGLVGSPLLLGRPAADKCTPWAPFPFAGRALASTAQLVD